MGRLSLCYYKCKVPVIDFYFQEQISMTKTRRTPHEQQLDWFKRQLFGRKSEKQIIYNSAQSSLFVSDQAPAHNSGPDIAATQRNKRRSRMSTARAIAP
jgi:hypothetical protein